MNLIITELKRSHIQCSLEHKIDAVPFAHEKMDEWRSNFKGIRFINEEDGYNFGGAVDDIWQKPSGELIVVDVKATSKNVFDWDDTFKSLRKLQLLEKALGSS